MTDAAVANVAALFAVWLATIITPVHLTALLTIRFAARVTPFNSTTLYAEGFVAH
jgi:hypothetical protein